MAAPAPAPANTAATASATAPRRWTSDHVYISPGPMSDRFLVDVAAPFLAQLDGAGDWFFIRYGEGGSHLRIRVAIDHDDVAARIHARWRAAAPDHVDHALPPLPALPTALPAAWPVRGATATTQSAIMAPGSVHATAYLPEIARYGGPHAMPLSEHVFCRSSALALGIIAATPDDIDRRVGQAIGIMIASVRTLTDDPAAIARILRDHARGWERWFARVGWPVATDAAAAPVTLRDPAAIAAALRAPIAPARSYGAAWHACLAALVAALAADPPSPTASRATDIVLSHLHMFCNRLGLSPAVEFHLARAIGGIAGHQPS